MEDYLRLHIRVLQGDRMVVPWRMVQVSPHLTLAQVFEEATVDEGELDFDIVERAQVSNRIDASERQRSAVPLETTLVRHIIELPYLTGYLRSRPLSTPSPGPSQGLSTNMAAWPCPLRLPLGTNPFVRMMNQAAIDKLGYWPEVYELSNFAETKQQVKKLANEIIILGRSDPSRFGGFSHPADAKAGQPLFWVLASALYKIQPHMKTLRNRHISLPAVFITAMENCAVSNPATSTLTAKDMNFQVKSLADWSRQLQTQTHLHFRKDVQVLHEALQKYLNHLEQRSQQRAELRRSQETLISSTDR